MRTLYYNWLLDELVTKFGEQAVDRVMASFASERIFVPLKCEGRILKALGPDIAKWLIAERGGKYINIPSKQAVQRKRKASATRIDVMSSDETARTLAKRHGVSERWVNE